VFLEFGFNRIACNEVACLNNFLLDFFLDIEAFEDLDKHYKGVLLTKLESNALCNAFYNRGFVIIFFKYCIGTRLFATTYKTEYFAVAL
jgi:hypothetical protein